MARKALAPLFVDVHLLRRILAVFLAVAVKMRQGFPSVASVALIAVSSAAVATGLSIAD